MGVRDQRLEADATLEQIGEMLVRLEVETHGAKRTRSLCTATVALSEPISTAERMDSYSAGKRDAIATLAHDVEARLHALLIGLESVATPT